MNIFSKLEFEKVTNYLSRTINTNINIYRLLKECEKFGDIILIGGAIKDIAFFNREPKDYDFIVITDNKLNLTIDKDIYDIKINSFGGYKIKVDNLIIDIWNCPSEKEISSSNCRFNLDDLYINLSNSTYQAKEFNNGIEEGLCKIISTKCTHPNKDRDYIRGLKLAMDFNLEYQYRKEK